MPEKNEFYYYNDENFLLVARNFFSPESLREFRQRFQEEKEKCNEGSTEREKSGVRLGLAVDKVRLNPQWYEVWKTCQLNFLENCLPPYTHVIFPPTLRTITEYNGFVPWHQDIAYVKAMGNRAHKKVATCFLPLDDHPSIRPSVEFHINPDQQYLEPIVRSGLDVNQFDLDEKDRPDPTSTFTFDLNLGDAFFFGQLVLHKTCFPSTTFPPRNSVEFRLTQSSCLIPGKDYFDLAQCRFIRHECDPRSPSFSVAMP